MKHAYLIMAHNEPYILEKLLQLIDDRRNDIYLHIDKKWKNFDFDYFKRSVKKSNLYFTKRLDVRWGTYSQIKCELSLMETASNNYKYAYYHIISGIDMPLATQDVMHDFFDRHQGKEFINFDNHKIVYPDTVDRIKYYHIFTKNGHSNNIFVRRIWGLIYRICLKFEKVLKVNRLKNVNFEIRKGANWVSITDSLVRYVLGKKDEIYNIYKMSLCADEVFLQTIVYNSEFYKKVISFKNDDYLAIKRYVDWKRGSPYIFKKSDFKELINSKCFFARKFSTKVDKEIVDMIFDYVRNGINDKS